MRMPRVRRHSWLLALPFLLCFAWILSSCGSDATPSGFCAAPKSEAVVISVRDAISGMSAAAGAIGTLVSVGGWKGGKEKGMVRSEGKEYVVADGDVMLFRFNV